jgi:hypothetical protein
MPNTSENLEPKTGRGRVLNAAGQPVQLGERVRLTGAVVGYNEIEGSVLVALDDELGGYVRVKAEAAQADPENAGGIPAWHVANEPPA